MEAAIVARDLTPLRREQLKTVRPLLRDVSEPAPACSTCHQHALCARAGLDAEASQRLGQIAAMRIRLRKGDTLFRAGDRFTALYAIRLGSCKTVMVTDDGHEQVSGYHMPGEILGTDGIGMDVHDSQAIALEDAEVCALPFDRVEALAREDVAFQRSLHRMLAGEIVRERNVMLMLGTMRAEQRLASFLLDLSQRYQARGYSPSEFLLRMTREEIGSHLGLKLETVSRLFSRFHQDGLIEVHGRIIKLVDRDALHQLVMTG
ncbi:MAG: helix-turn-helix domain-containing protein [Betaproteobacteria bacterium]|nr:helix-turn-helix domain-containing protein [Betaproteobacteria bacterium]MDE2210088.1 helix-turn-helix domain-containing protein [Betaproteobacteria bacterium]